MEDIKPIQIDIRKVIMAKVPKYGKFIPGFVYRWLAHIIRQDVFNRILTENHGKYGHDFATGALLTLGMRLEVRGLENIPSEGRFIFASNHPLGGLDGIALISVLGNKYGGNVKCIVNDLLMAVKPMENVFLPINKHGSQSRSSADAIEKAYASDCQMIMFPAGLCSRKGKDGVVRDLEWQKSFIVKSITSKRDIIPVYFGGLNSKFFYNFAKLRLRLGIKFNIEMVQLPAELVKGAGKTLTITFGKPIRYTTFDNSKTPKEWAAEVKSLVYRMADDNK